MNDESMAPIDLALTFFLSVLVLFVFVEFHLASTPQEPPPASLGQETPTLEATPPTWRPVNERGGFAVFSDGRLTRLNMQGLGAVVVDPLLNPPADQGGLSWTGGQAGIPNSFVARVRLSPTQTPETWRAGPALDPATAACPAGWPRLLTVFAPLNEADLGPLVDFAGRCGWRLRFEIVKPAGSSERLSFAIGLSPQAYSRERMFR